MSKVSTYIWSLINYVDHDYPELLYFLPNYFHHTANTITENFLMIRLLPLPSSGHWNLVYFESGLTKAISNAININDHTVFSYISFMSKHLADNQIPNPAQQLEIYRGLNVFSYFDEFLKKLETHPVAKLSLLENFMRAIINQSGSFVPFLRLLNEDLYNDNKKGSKYFRGLLVDLFQRSNSDAVYFRYWLMEIINSYLTEIKSEYDNYINTAIGRNRRMRSYARAMTYYGEIYQSMRVLELIISLNPYNFLVVDRMFSERTSNICMHIIREGIQGQLSKVINELQKTDYKVYETTKMLFSPIAGIYLQLHNILLQKNRKGNLTTMEDYIVKADGFEMEFMKSFITVLREDNKPYNLLLYCREFVVLEKVVNSLEGYIAKNMPQVLSG